MNKFIHIVNNNYKNKIKCDDTIEYDTKSDNNTIMSMSSGTK